MSSPGSEDPRASNLRPLNGVSGGTSESLAAHAQETYGASGPSMRIESAEGITTYPGLNGDAESGVARTFISKRLATIEGNPGKAADTGEPASQHE